MLGNFACFLSFVDFFFFFLNQLFQKNLSGVPSVSNSLDPDQSRRFVWPDLGPNCLQTVWERINRGDCLIQVAFKAGLTICLKMYDNVPYDLHPVRAQIILHKHPSDLSCFWALQHPNKMHILNGK